jgi:hypothetical protein
LENDPNYKIPLSELLAFLKANGYEVSIERIIEIQTALLSTPVYKLSLPELKYIITPMLARSEDDQKNIYRLIDTYIADKIKKKESRYSGFRSWLGNKHLVFRLRIAGFLLVISSAIALYFFQQKGVAKKALVNTPRQFLASDTTATGKVGKSKNISPEPGRAPVKKFPVPAAEVQYGGKPIVPERLNIILQISCAFGFGLGGILYNIIFYSRKKIMDTGKRTRQEDDTPDITKKESKDDYEQLLYTALQFQDNNYLRQVYPSTRRVKNCELRA